jgi:hypothetical protein
VSFSYTTQRTTDALARMASSSLKTTLASAMNTAGAAIATAFTNANPAATSPSYLAAEDSFVKTLERVADELNDTT